MSTLEPPDISSTSMPESAPARTAAPSMNFASQSGESAASLEYANTDPRAPTSA